MRQSVWTDHLRRSVVALGACGIAFGLAACGSTGETPESAEPSSISESSAAESPAAEQDTEEAADTEEGDTEEGDTEEGDDSDGDDSDGDGTTFSPCDLETDGAAPDSRLGSLVGEWTAVGESFLGDSEGQGSLLCIDGDGDVSYSSVDGDWIGALTAGEVPGGDLQLESLDNQALTEWFVGYDSEPDTIDVGEPGGRGFEYARVK
ncbi:hypothetical protein C8K30_10435 [Promicromonospora sp. AC04]|uniref:hypothetical protein n=1 Tax=Promicromonospora sp. AC04 TaxID=2135723 RepID=UPI000D4DB73A|nr:hypothetical protein [Promicromonospora sp. AC04]PUB27588.1 hypothetical protein C8K30_10435 [Promicromonospora sp. AC04]